MKRIGITAFYQRSEARRMTSVDRQYIEAIIDQGALPIVIPTTADYDLAKEYIANCDGLLVTGGCDVNPLTYHAEPNPHVVRYSTERDLFEDALIKAAIEKDIPIMGICRGIQMINVSLGGNLIQHIPDEVKDCICHCEEGNEQWEPCHTAKISPDSILYPIFGDVACVNSYHHQAVKDLGKDLVPIAYAPDGVLEAFQHKTKKIFAVQWHPEKMFHHDDKERAVFKAFVDLIK